MEGDFQYWCDLLDGVAERANTSLHEARDGIHSSPPRMLRSALVAIADQLAYANAVAAAEFYMTNKVFADLDETEGGAE